MPITIQSHNQTEVAVRCSKDFRLMDAIKSLPRDSRRWTGREWLVRREYLNQLLALPAFQEAEIAPLLVEEEPLPGGPPRPGGLAIDLPGGTLRPYQVEDLEYIFFHQGRALVADVMGLGKTPTALAWLYNRPDLRPALVVCPASIKLQWGRQAARWLHGLDLRHPRDLPPAIALLQGTKSAPVPAQAQVAIVNYDIMSKRLSDILAWRPRVVVFDESHYIKEAKANRSKAARVLAQQPQVQSVLGLTGTPVKNRPGELWHQVLCINPTIWPNWFQFAMRYCDPQRHQTTAKRDEQGRVLNKQGLPVKEAGGEVDWNVAWNFRGASNLNQLDSILRQRVMVRHLKDVLGMEEPDPITLPFEGDLREYQRVRKQIRERLRALREDLRRQRQTIEELPEAERAKALEERAERNSMARLYGYVITEITQLRQEAARAKMPAAIEWTKDFLESGEALVVFTWHHEISEMLIAALNAETEVANPAPLDGRMPARKRQEWADRFIAGEWQVLVCNLQAMGIGMDGLQRRASYLAFAEMGWSPSDHAQAIGRLHRDGQQHPVTPYYLLCADTIDEDISKLLDAKNSVTSAVVGEMDQYGILESIVDLVVDEEG